MFSVSEKFLTSDGYLAVYQEAKKEAAPAKLPPLKKGQKLQSRFSMISSETAPPKRYTSGSMILAMENAGNLIEDETLREEIKSTGIGTSATRAAVIQKLCDISYIEANKKTQVLTPTMIGIEVFKVVRKTLPAMLMPKYTASWETGLHRIESGEMTAAAFRQTLYAYIETNIEKIRSMDSKKREPVQKRESGTCPICGATLYETEKSFICGRYKRDGSGCGFMFGKNMPGRPLKDIETQALLNGKSTPFTNDFVSKEGKSYLARIKVAENGTCSIDFPADETSLKCPKCGVSLSMTKYSYTCGNRCGFSVYHTYSGHRLTENEFKSLIKEKIIGPLDGFRQRDGTPFTAFLIYNGKGVFICKTVIGGKTIEKKDILPLTKKKKTDYMEGFTKIRNNRAKLVIQDNGYVGMEFPS
jgi:DNA topoisomerase-3